MADNDPDALSPTTQAAWANIAAAIAQQGQGKSKVGDTFRKIVTVEGRAYTATARFIDENGHFDITELEATFTRPEDDPAETRARAEAAKAVVDLDLAQWASDNDIPQLKAKYDLAQTHAQVEGLREKNKYIGAEALSALATAAQSIARSKSEQAIAEAAAPGERAERTARTGLLGAQTTQQQMENAVTVLGGLATYEERDAALEDMVRRRVITPEIAAQIGTRYDEELATGVPAAERFKETKAAERQGVTEAGALERQKSEEAAAAGRATQQQQVTAATSIAGDEAARQRQLLQSTVQQQANQATASTNFLQHFATLADPNAAQAGQAASDGLSRIERLFGSLERLSQPSPQLGQSQGFLGNLLAGGPVPAPAVAGPAAPVGTGVANAAPGVAPGAPEQDIFDDSLMGAAAMEDNETLLDPGDVAQIQQLRQTDPRRAVNLTVEAWQRAVRGSGQATRAGRAEAVR